MGKAHAIGANDKPETGKNLLRDRTVSQTKDCKISALLACFGLFKTCDSQVYYRV